jgi:short-subunit dehydrogenase
MAATVLITGASQGSGKAIAQRFAREGYSVVLAARQADRLYATADEINQAIAPCAVAIPTDVSHQPSVMALVEQTLERYGTVDVLVNNAGICLTGKTDHTSIDDWHALINTNLWGYIHTIHALLPQFLKNQRGAIVNVGSFGGKMPLPNMTAYCTSKYAVTGLTESLRLELAPCGIHVGIVQPGVINSSFMERAQFRGESDEECDRQQAQMASVLSQGWVNQPDDIAQAVWQVATHKTAEIVVGPVAIATEAYRLMPSLVQWFMTQTLPA